MRSSNELKMHDKDVREATWKMINRRKCNNGPDVLKLNEFDLCREARADITVINGHMTGYELKSASDNLNRLKKQIEYYSRILDYCNLVVAENHFSAALDLLPPDWGIYKAKESQNGKVYIRKYRAAKLNTSRLDPWSIAQLLWRPEILRILDEYEIGYGNSYLSRFVLWDKMVEIFTLSQLRKIVRETLKKRVGWHQTTLSE